MPRRPRVSTGGYVFHVLNRAVGRQQIFDTEGDYFAFLRVLHEAGQRVPMRLLSFCIMPNHWHLLLWPKADGDLSEYMQWLTVTHTQRWHACHQTSGTGPIYQGRFKSFPVQEDDHLLIVGRYIERNPLRAQLVPTAELWRWSSLWQMVNERADLTLAAWPVSRPHDWVLWVNTPQSEAELAAVRSSVVHSRPFGNSTWQLNTARRLGLMATLRSQGRPRGS